MAGDSLPTFPTSHGAASSHLWPASASFLHFPCHGQASCKISCSTPSPCSSPLPCQGDSIHASQMLPQNLLMSSLSKSCNSLTTPGGGSRAQLSLFMPSSPVLCQASQASPLTSNLPTFRLHWALWHLLSHFPELLFGS